MMTTPSTQARSPQTELDFGAHLPSLYRFALARTRDRDSAADVVQDTLLAALENGASFAGRSALRTWLTAILKHKIIDQQRAQHRGLQFYEQPAPRDGDNAMARGAFNVEDSPAPRSVWCDPEHALEHKRMSAAVERAVAALPDSAARVFHMREVLGCSTEEVSKSLGISENNCCVILHRARNALRGMLDESGFRSQR